MRRSSTKFLIGRAERWDPRGTSRYPSTHVGKLAGGVTANNFSPRDESGSSLILALVFLIVVSLIAISLASWAGSGLINVVNFKSARSAQVAANAATETAIQNVRYNFLAAQTLNPPSSPQPCWTASPTLSQVTVSSQTIAVWCSTVWSPVSHKTRTVTISACSSSVTTGDACLATPPLLTVVVIFDDYPSVFGGSNCAPVLTSSGTSTCGTGVTVKSWVFSY